MEYGLARMAGHEPEQPYFEAAASRCRMSSSSGHREGTQETPCTVLPVIDRGMSVTTREPAANVPGARRSAQYAPHGGTRTSVLDPIRSAGISRARGRRAVTICGASPVPSQGSGEHVQAERIRQGERHRVIVNSVPGIAVKPFD
jgi:hypothetical protein